MTSSTWPKHASIAGYVPTYTACDSNHAFAGGETAHHKTNINMAMKLDNGDLSSNAKENMSTFSMHFHKVLNNHRPVDDSVLELIPQKPCLTSLQKPSKP